MESVLRVKDLDIRFRNTSLGTETRVVRGVSLDIRAGEIHALVGESGSGKSVSALSVIGLLDRRKAVVSGSIRLEEKEILGLSERELRPLRGSRIAMIFQEPRKYLDPSMRVGAQLAETLVLRESLPRGKAEKRSAELLRSVELDDVQRVLRAYPHELSGGMCQRVMIAQAVASRPALLIADEPTTALDASRRAGIERLIRDRSREFGTAVLFISHDLRSVAKIADRVSVMYAGRVVESTSIGEFQESPRHPYTRLLRMAIPEASRRGTHLQDIAGQIPEPGNLPSGCSFHPRCPYAEDACARELPGMRAAGGDSIAACRRMEDLWRYW